MMTHKKVRKVWNGLASKVCSVVWNRETLEKITELKTPCPKKKHTKKKMPRGPKCEGSSHISSGK